MKTISEILPLHPFTFPGSDKRYVKLAVYSVFKNDHVLIIDGLGNKMFIHELTAINPL
jgi:hypothetical protein